MKIYYYRFQDFSYEWHEGIVIGENEEQVKNILKKEYTCYFEGCYHLYIDCKNVLEFNNTGGMFKL